MAWRHAEGAMRFDEVVIGEIERDCSFKIFKLSAEGVGQTSQAAVTQRGPLQFDRESLKRFRRSLVKKTWTQCRPAD
jgi:hypothetical protein